MQHGRHGRARRGVWVTAMALGAMLPLAAFAGRADAEENPFLPPQERQADMDQRLQKRIDKAVSAMEERLTRSLLDALDGKAKDGQLPRALQDAMGRRATASALPATASPGAGALPPLPGLPPLPNLPAGGDAVPAGAVFIGCLDGRAFFQDRAGSPILVDPRAFPPSAGGAAACAQ